MTEADIPEPLSLTVEYKSWLYWTCHKARLSLQDMLQFNLQGGRRRGRKKTGWMENDKVCPTTHSSPRHT
ncbi:hypothetical protein DPMN_148058 [Dreissena polymorpha]|uniref:Uncharacterized protein n=1 Tax=Dreissena polymorpha TaxID=45954 RepID=A0A9D4J3K9_DREPO|nr:hypothetical protein DPMN_148058 [Dreissena polymorpha]